VKNKEKRQNLSKVFVFSSLVLVFLDWFLQYSNKITAFGTENRGISFGLVGELGEYLRYIVPAFFVFVGMWFWRAKGFRSVFWVLLLIGGIGNLIPRMFWGYVWDYIKLPVFNLWINLSDILIFVSTLSYILVGDDRDPNSTRDR